MKREWFRNVTVKHREKRVVSVLLFAANSGDTTFTASIIQKGRAVMYVCHNVSQHQHQHVYIHTHICIN